MYYTIFRPDMQQRGIAQLVERRSPKPQVEGSIPSAPASKAPFFGTGLFQYSLLFSPDYNADRNFY